uniref:Integrase catalytic domain-containing protein n=1 Tax=Physcomitrium patens TaxID=3218 RepID=A0A2K1KM91_PHYPA|nr:hypothetical protein PHYPA_005780 [Physcomitrium patens]
MEFNFLNKFCEIVAYAFFDWILNCFEAPIEVLIDYGRNFLHEFLGFTKGGIY